LQPGQFTQEKAYVDVKITSEVKIYSLRPNVFKPEQTENVSFDAENVKIDLK